MEVQSITKSRKIRYQLKVKLSLAGQYLNHINEDQFQKLIQNVEISDIDPHIKVDFNKQHLNILLAKHPLTIPINVTNIRASISLCQKLLIHQDSFQSIDHGQERIAAQISKKVRQHQLLVQTNSHNNSSLSDIIDTNRLFSKTSKIQSIPPTILSINLFKGFQSCQLLVHEKGKQIVKNYLVDDQNPIKTSEISVSDFNVIFSQIKKSKNKLFNQAQILQNCPGILGTFLAKDYDLSSYRVVLIVSRNDFLPPSIEEQQYFATFSSQLYSIYSKVLYQEKYIDKICKIKGALKSAPFPVMITNTNGLTIFQNNYLSTGHVFDSFKLPLEHSIHLQISTNSNQYADAYHLQRITLLGELLNTLRHELSNPLFGIKLMADLFHSNVLSEDAKEIFKEISHSCHRCQKIIENFSFLYRDEKSFICVNLKRILHETSTLTKSATQNIQKEIIIEDKNNEHLLDLQSNPTWISQIIFNLIVNSAQALHQAKIDYPKISIRISLQNDHYILSISDNGPGITAEIEKQIFEPFFTTKPKGTGLGLSICTNLAKKLGGEIFFQNNTSEAGVTFTLRLPRGK